MREVIKTINKAIESFIGEELPEPVKKEEVVDKHNFPDTTYPNV